MDVPLIAAVGHVGVCTLAPPRSSMPPDDSPASRLLRDPLSTPMEVAGVPKTRLEEAIDCVMNPHIGAPVTVVTSTSTSTTPASRRRAYSTCRISTLRRDVLCILVTRNMDNWGRVH